MKTIALHNLGCKVNAYEFDVMQQNLIENGFKIVPFDEKADVYLVNTCSVTNIADRKSRQMLHRAKHQNPDAIVVAVGCYVQTGEETLRHDECIDLAVGNNRKKDLVSILLAYMEEHKQKRSVGEKERFYEEDLIDINHTDEYEEMQLKKTADHSRAYIKIQDGCNQFCSYCVIPYARGRVRSRKKEDILSEVKGMVEAGYQEIVVTGIHLSSYGIDFTNQDKNPRDYMESSSSLPDLLEELNEVEGLQRIRLGSLEPRIITEQFTKRLQKMDKLCPHFHLSLQSGCDETLRRMNRHYTAAEYASKVALLREALPGCAITTDVIVGFPGETEEEFETTREYLEKLSLYEMHIFKYSKRKGTVAATMPCQVPDDMKATRSDILLNLTASQSADYRRQFIGKELDILLEEVKTIEGNEYMIGHSREYILAAVPYEKADKIDFLTKKAVRKVRATRLSEDGQILVCSES